MDNYTGIPLKGSGVKSITCPLGDRLCIADHQGGDSYCVHEATGLSKTDVPEALGGLGDAVISPGTLDTSKKLTETEKAWKRWNDSWLEGIDYKTEIKPRTGRRLFRNNRAGDGKQRQLPRVRGCGHRLDMKRQPRHRNCKPCWTAFFRNQDEMAENVAKIIVEQGAYRIVETFGLKFLTRFHEYCKLVEHMESLRRAQEEHAGLGLEAIPTEPNGSDAEVGVEVG